MLKKLHCLPVEQCTVFRDLFTSFFTQVFLDILLHIFLLTAVLIVPGAVKVVVISMSFQSSTLGFINLSGNSFAFDAPTVWNALPDEICDSSSIASFRKQLKTYLYTKAYPP